MQTSSDMTAEIAAKNVALRLHSFINEVEERRRLSTGASYEQIITEILEEIAVKLKNSEPGE